MQHYRRWIVVAVVVTIMLAIAGVLVWPEDDDNATPIAQQPTADDAAPSIPAVQLAHSTAIGPETALVTIVEYGTYGCQVCRHIHQFDFVEQLLVRYPADIRYIYIPWPIIHVNDPMATQAAFCALEQGYDAFWVFHQALYNLSYAAYNDYDHPTAYVELANIHELDGEALGVCLRADRYREHVFDLVDEGLRLQLPGTPSFFVNGTLTHAYNLEQVTLDILNETRPLE